MSDTATAALLLYVEDDLLIQVDVEGALAEAGFTVVVASTGEEAIAQLERQADAFRAVITDVHLGQGPDGWEVARRARELKADMPIVYVTAHGAPDWSARGVPGSQIIAKPFVAAQIIVAVTTLINATATPFGPGGG